MIFSLIFSFWFLQQSKQALLVVIEPHALMGNHNQQTSPCLFNNVTKLRRDTFQRKGIKQ
jgi:hypothetical protein